MTDQNWTGDQGAEGSPNPDSRPEGERIPYLTYVGGDEYLTGKRLGEYALEQAEAGNIPKPTGVVCASHDSAHQGLKAWLAWRSPSAAGRW